MELLESTYTIVIINKGFSPSALSSLDLGESLNLDKKNEVVIPPLFKLQYEDKYFIQAFEGGKLQITLNSLELGDDFNKVQEMGLKAIDSFDDFKTTAIGLNFKGKWLSESFDINEWRRKFFKLDDSINPLNNNNLKHSEFKFSIAKNEFTMNIKLSEDIEDEKKGIKCNVNNDYNFGEGSTDLDYLKDIINNSNEILRETKSEIEAEWIN